MGQNWVMMAPEAKEVVNFSGKIGEMLFDGSAEALVELLAVPVPPSDPALVHDFAFGHAYG